NAGGLPRHSVQISSSWRIRLCSRPCVQLKKCARACTRSDASRLRTIDSICRKSVAAERASVVLASALPGRIGACAVSDEVRAVVALLLLLGWASRTMGAFDERVLLAWAIATPAALFGAHRLLPLVLPRLLAAEGLRKTAVIAGANDLGRGLAARLCASPVQG